MSTLQTILPTMLLAGLLMGCGSARRGIPLQPPLVIEDAKAAREQQVFMRFCNGCHPGGAGGVGLALNNKPLPGWAIRFQVRRGLGVMPAFSEDVIDDPQLHVLVAYLKTLRRHDG